LSLTFLFLLSLPPHFPLLLDRLIVTAKDIAVKNGNFHIFHYLEEKEKEVEEKKK